MANDYGNCTDPYSQSSLANTWRVDDYGRGLRLAQYQNLQQQMLEVGKCADVSSLTVSCMDIREGMFVYFKGQLLGRVYRIRFERLAVEIMDMDTGYRDEYPEHFLRKCEFTCKPKEPMRTDTVFEQADYVEIVANTTSDSRKFAGYRGYVMSPTKAHLTGSYYVKLDEGAGMPCVWNYELKLVKKGTSKMSSVSDKFAALLKGEPEKSFFKAGLTNKDDSFTDEGKQVFEAWLLKKFKSEFNTEVVQPILEEMKEERK